MGGWEWVQERYGHCRPGTGGRALAGGQAIAPSCSVASACCRTWQLGFVSWFRRSTTGPRAKWGSSPKHLERHIPIPQLTSSPWLAGEERMGQTKYEASEVTPPRRNQRIIPQTHFRGFSTSPWQARGRRGWCRASECGANRGAKRLALSPPSGPPNASARAAEVAAMDAVAPSTRPRQAPVPPGTVS